MKLAARASALVFALFFTAVVTAQNAEPRLPQPLIRPGLYLEHQPGALIQVSFETMK